MLLNHHQGLVNLILNYLEYFPTSSCSGVGLIFFVLAVPILERPRTPPELFGCQNPEHKHSIEHHQTAQSVYKVIVPLWDLSDVECIT